MRSYKVKVKDDSEKNFFNLRQLDEVTNIMLIGKDDEGHQIYRVETEIDLSRELELADGVIELASE